MPCSLITLIDSNAYAYLAQNQMVAATNGAADAYAYPLRNETLSQMGLNKIKRLRAASTTLALRCGDHRHAAVTGSIDRPYTEDDVVLGNRQGHRVLAA